jgi:hypothetical protein
MERINPMDPTISNPSTIGQIGKQRGESFYFLLLINNKISLNA